MKRVLILTASFGDGHNAAARNLSDALELLCPEVKVEVVDLFGRCYGTLNTMARKAYNGIVRFAPALWGGIYALLDSPLLSQNGHLKLNRLQVALGQLLQDTQPDCVVSTYPVYANVIQDLFGDHAERPFRFLTVVTDSITINSAWLQAPSDIYCVPNEATAAVLRARGVAAAQVRPLGFPVSPLFCQDRQTQRVFMTGVGTARPQFCSDEASENAGDEAVPAPVKGFHQYAPRETAPPDPGEDGPYRILYLVNTGKQKVGKAIRKLLEVPGVELTITVGRNAELKAKLVEKLKPYANRVQVLGWTNQMPHLMKTHHLLIGKAGGALVQETIAACCPMIANQVIPGQEEGNARLLVEQDIGTVARKPSEVVRAVQKAFRKDAREWRRWRQNLAHISRPDAALHIAQLVLAECEAGGAKGELPPTLSPPPPGAPASLPACATGPNRRQDAGAPGETRPVSPGTRYHSVRPLLCDFHTHTNYSDGKLSVSELIDFYGQRGFDCLCITDHLADSRRLVGKLSKLTRLTLRPNQLEEYFEVIDRERRRAWRKYQMLVMTGLEFNKDGLTKKSSAHLLGIDLTQPIVDHLALTETIVQIHAQGGLAIASHPHLMKSEWGKNTLYLWEKQDIFAPLLDAWEIANRNNMFNPVSAKRLPYVANSDFHKPRHIYSWKTLVTCEKHPEAIKECIRKNERVAITLFRENETAPSLLASPLAQWPSPVPLPAPLPRKPSLLPAA